LFSPPHVSFHSSSASFLLDPVFFVRLLIASDYKFRATTLWFQKKRKNHFEFKNECFWKK
jgi:type IV secretory pathway VirB3-like protein